MQTNELHASKQRIRRHIALLKRSCGETTLLAHSKAIQKRLEETDVFHGASCVALYNAIAGEVQTMGLLERWYEKKQLLLPRVVGEDLSFSPYKGVEALKVGAFGIMEPDDLEAEVAAKDIDLVIVPGVAFDRGLNRLGRGGGYYDRWLSSLDVPTIGLCFNFQLMDAIPTEAFDKKMDMIITEKEIIIG